MGQVLAGTVLTSLSLSLASRAPSGQGDILPLAPCSESSAGSGCSFSMDFQERGPPSLSESTQSAKSSSAQQV